MPIQQRELVLNSSALAAEIFIFVVELVLAVLDGLHFVRQVQNLVQFSLTAILSSNL